MIKNTDIRELKLISRGKVRDIYEYEDKLLLVTTDRISAFDYILNQTVPGKGIVLNQISQFFFKMTEDIVENHIIHADFALLPDYLQKYEYLKGRFAVVKKAKPLPVECIIRGYITGSGWKEYKKSRTIGSMHIAQDMVESEQFEKPLFTPSTKADQGHDENISYEQMKEIVSADIGEKVKSLTESIFKKCSDYALSKNIIIADTKMEFGIINDEIIIIDELLTPDSSRFWNRDNYEKGHSQESYDKQFIRDYLSSTGWDRNSAPPDIPDDIIEKTSDIYKNIYRKLTDNELS